MKLSYNKKSPDPIYYVQKGYRIGKKTTTKTIARIGKHSELLKITDDPLAYAYKKLEEMQKEEENRELSDEFEIDFELKVSRINENISQTTQLNIGYFYLQFIYNQLALDVFFKKVTTDRSEIFDFDLINRFLVIDHILSSGSILETCKHVSNYFEKPDIQYQQMFRFLDILAENFDGYIEHLFEKSNKLTTRNTSVCYFDCSNFYFETESEDEDYIDLVTGEPIKGFRKFGDSREHRSNPIVKMGLFMNSDGIPLSMAIDSENTSEQIMTVPGEKKLIRMIGKNDFICCADAELESANIRLFNSLGGRLFIVTQSIPKLSDVMKKRIFEDKDYRYLSDDKSTTISFLKSFDLNAEENLHFYNDKAYKVLACDILIDIGLYEEKITASGKKRRVKSNATFSQCVIVTFSRKFYEYQCFIRNRQIECAKEYLTNPDPEEIGKVPENVKRFIKCVSSAEPGVEGKTTYILDEEKIREEEKYDGFYGIVTNLSVLDENGDPSHSEIRRIIEIMELRNLIKEFFCIFKRNFDVCPLFVSKKNYSIAHFMICFTALLICRLLEKKLNSNEEHFTIDEILTTLKNMNIADSRGRYFMSLYNEGKVLKALERLANLRLDRMYYQPKTLNKIIRSIR